MKVYFTQSCKHLVNSFEQGNFEYKHYPNGELYVRILDEPRKECYVVGSFPSPIESLMELCLLLDGLLRLGSKVNLIITYFGYSRHDRVVEKGEAVGLQVVANMLKQFKLDDAVVIHPHSEHLQEFFRCRPIMPFFDEALGENDLIVAPDIGAVPFASQIAETCSMDLAYMEKIRVQGKVRVVDVVGEVKGKNALIVDDMIDQGSTVMEATKLLLSRGVESVNVYATHGVLSEHAVQRLEIFDLIKNVYVTDSLPPKQSKKIKVLSLVPVLKEIIGK